jgi:hypothetical protein
MIAQPLQPGLTTRWLQYSVFQRMQTGWPKTPLGLESYEFEHSKMAAPSQVGTFVIAVIKRLLLRLAALPINHCSKRQQHNSVAADVYSAACDPA